MKYCMLVIKLFVVGKIFRHRTKVNIWKIRTCICVVLFVIESAKLKIVKNVSQHNIHIIRLRFQIVHKTQVERMIMICLHIQIGNNLKTNRNDIWFGKLYYHVPDFNIAYQ